MMTTPQDIQAALDALRRYSEKMARYKAYAPTEHGSDSYGDYLTIHDFIQSHAPAQPDKDLIAVRDAISDLMDAVGDMPADPSECWPDEWESANNALSIVNRMIEGAK